jgi:hypothetical protein
MLIPEQFNNHGIAKEKSDRTTSDYFQAYLPIITSRRSRLLDNPRIGLQFSSLERRASRIGAKDSVGHPVGGHDDICTVIAGLMVRLLARGQHPTLENRQPPSIFSLCLSNVAHAQHLPRPRNVT